MLIESSYFPGNSKMKSLLFKRQDFSLLVSNVIILKLSYKKPWLLKKLESFRHF
jgi:hypothetical protein